MENQDVSTCENKTLNEFINEWRYDCFKLWILLYNDRRMLMFENKYRMFL